jgi:hypothetical protein
MEYVRYIRKPDKKRRCCGGSSFFVAIADEEIQAFGQINIDEDTVHVEWYEAYSNCDIDMLPTEIPLVEIKVINI